MYHFFILYHNYSLVIKGYLHVKNYDLNWARTHAGLTQAEAAEKMGVDRKTFNRWETGVVNIPRVRWHKFLKILELAVSDIPAFAVRVAATGATTLPTAITATRQADGLLRTPYLPDHLQQVGDRWLWGVEAYSAWMDAMNADVGGLKGRRVVDAVTGHGHHIAQFVEFADNVLFLLGHGACKHNLLKTK